MHSALSQRQNLKPYDLPADLDERLWEWGYFFRDRKRLEHCKSIEHRYRRTSGDADPDGWGDIEATPKAAPAKSYRLPRAVEVHEVIQTLDKKYKWALTYGYCFPGLPRHLVLRLMKKFTGSHLNWNRYLDVLDIGRIRVYSLLRRI